MIFKNYYNILGITTKATQKEIKLSYRKLAKTWHPDKNPSPQAKHKFQYISEAYQTLSNPQKRQAYDSDYWYFVSFDEGLIQFQQEIHQMMEQNGQKRQKAHQQWMNDFEQMWANQMAKARAFA